MHCGLFVCGCSYHILKINTCQCAFVQSVNRSPLWLAGPLGITSGHWVLGTRPGREEAKAIMPPVAGSPFRE